MDKLEAEAGMTFDQMFDIARRAEFTWRVFKHCTEVFEFIVNSKQEISQLESGIKKFQLDYDALEHKVEGLEAKRAWLEGNIVNLEARQLELINDVSRLEGIAKSDREAILALG